MNSPEHPHHFRYALSDLLLTNRFASLPPAFHTRLSATPLPAPYLVCASEAAADLIGLDRAAFGTTDFAEVFSGNAVMPGSMPLSAVYSGHQFGVWSGQLGDGRAIL
ncbi:MAG: protein adenylyltransferase SelO family protein, partial [Burkholderiaceae bacterium]